MKNNKKAFRIISIMSGLKSKRAQLRVSLANFTPSSQKQTLSMPRINLGSVVLNGGGSSRKGTTKRKSLKKNKPKPWKYSGIVERRGTSGFLMGDIVVVKEGRVKGE